MTIVGPTVKERILLHLFDYNRFADAYEAPFEITQTGIAQAVSTRVSHIAQYLKPLLSDGEILEKTSRIKEGPRRRKVYFLTIEGRHRVASQRSILLKETVPYTRASGEIEETSLSRIYHEERRGSTLLQLLQELKSTGLSATVAEEEQPAAVVDFSHEAPKVEQFYGRARELEEVLRSLERSPLVVVTGLAGIGKSSLGSRVCEELRGKRSLFWRRIRPWDSAMDLASRMAAFLKAHGRTRLQTYLAGSGAKELSAIEDNLRSDLKGVVSVLVFDDVHTATEDAVRFLSILLEAIKGQEGVSALLLTRTTPTFYSRQDVSVEGFVVEYLLKGLDRDSSDSLLRDAGIPDPLIGNIIDASGNSPLFLRILARSSQEGVPRQHWRTLASYIAEEIDPSLDEEERNCLRIASLYQVPVAAQGLLLGKTGGMSTVIGLQRKALLDELDTGEVLLHDFLRDYFLKGTPLGRRETLVNSVVPWLLKEAEEADLKGKPLDAISFLENAVVVEVDPNRQSSNLIFLGRLRRAAEPPDPTGAVEAYRRALRYTEDPADKALIHSEIADVLFELRRTGLRRDEEWREEVEKGLQLLPSGPSVEASILQLQMAHWDLHEEKFDDAWEVVERVQSWQPHFPESYRLLAWLRLVRGDLFSLDPEREDGEVVLAEYRAMIGMYERLRRKERLSGPLPVGNPYLLLAWAAYRYGEAEQALTSANEALDVDRRAGRDPLVSILTKARCLADLKGDYRTAETMYREAYELEKKGIDPFAIWSFRHLTDLYWREGRVEEARESLDHFLIEIGDWGSPRILVENHALMSRICVACGDSDSAESYLKETRAVANKVPSDESTYFLEWASAVMYAHRGDVEAAEASFGHALGLPTPRYRGASIHRILASKPLRGEVLLDYGRFLGSTGREKRARAVLLEAREEFERLGRRPLEQTAREAIQSLRST